MKGRRSRTRRPPAGSDRYRPIVYRPAHFSEDRPEVVDALLRDAAFGHLVVATGSGLDAVPLPFLVDRVGDSLVVRAHVATANPIWDGPLADAFRAEYPDVHAEAFVALKAERRQP